MLKYKIIYTILKLKTFENNIKIIQAVNDRKLRDLIINYAVQIKWEKDNLRYEKKQIKYLLRCLKIKSIPYHI